MMRQQGMSPEGMDMQQHSPGDPFIGSNGGTFAAATASDNGGTGGTLHTKQESGDSGLGGMGNAFSLARAPGDEFMEESMDEGRLSNGNG